LHEELNLFWKRKKGKVDKNNYKEIMKKIEEAIDDLLQGKDSREVEKMLTHEVENWWNNTIFKGKSLDEVSLRAGVCFGVWYTLKWINAQEERRSMSYIS